MDYKTKGRKSFVILYSTTYNINLALYMKFKYKKNIKHNKKI